MSPAHIVQRTVILCIYQLIIQSTVIVTAESEYPDSDNLVSVHKYCSKGKVVTIVPTNGTFQLECLAVVEGKNWTGFFYDRKTLQPSHKTKYNILDEDIPCESEVEDEDPFQPFLATTLPLADICKTTGTTADKHLFILLTSGETMWRSKKCPCRKCENWRPNKSKCYIDGLGCPAKSGDGATYSGLESHQIMYCCKSKFELGVSGFTEKEIQANLYHSRVNNALVVALMLAAFFYLLTALIYALLWQSQNLPGRTLFSVVLSRAFMCIFMFLANIGRLYRWDVYSPSWCKILGILTYFFLISAYTWMALLNFDFWWTFRTLKPSKDSAKLNKKYLQYSGFGLTTPLLIAGISLIINEFYKERDDGNIYFIPDYGNGICFMVSCATAFYTLVIPAFFLLPAFIFSILTFYALYKVKQETKRVHGARHGKAADVSNYQLYVKLFIVMGVSWSIDLIVWSIEEAVGDEENFTVKTVLFSLHWIDLVGSSIVIFVVFACKKATLKQLEQKIPLVARITTGFQEFKSSIPFTSSKSTASTSVQNHSQPSSSNDGNVHSSFSEGSRAENTRL